MPCRDNIANRRSNSSTKGVRLLLEKNGLSGATFASVNSFIHSLISLTRGGGTNKHSPMLPSDPTGKGGCAFSFLYAF